jgi:prephenate dehydratase
MPQRACGPHGLAYGMVRNDVGGLPPTQGKASERVHVKVAIQGELGSFSNEATLGFFPQGGVEIVTCALSAEVFERLERGEADAAVVPIENSLAGPVAEHYDLLLAHDAAIERESMLRIRHNLIGVPGAKLEGLRKVMSHPIALAQCRRFLAGQPHIQVQPFYDTAGSVKYVMEQGDATLAGIASAQAAVEYGGEIVRANIEDNAENFTRFHVVRRAGECSVDPAANKISLAFGLENRPGTLVKALEKLAEAGADLTKIESRPVPGRPWEYIFYVDVRYAEASVADKALAALQAHCPMVKELGRYRAA